MTMTNDAHEASGDLEIEIAGERLRLMPERAVYWARERTLFVADLHLGKAATFRAATIPVPEGMTNDDLHRLRHARERTEPQRVVFLGDLLHAKSGRAPQTLAAAAAAIHEDFAAIDLLLVRGNHDRGAGDPPEEWGIRCVDAEFVLAPFTLMHEPAVPLDGYGLAGHLHPAVELRGRGGQSLRLPCFWFGQRVGVLPAFGSFTGTALVKPLPSDRVFVIAEDQVIALKSPL